MKKLIISNPDKNNDFVKHLLKRPGVIIQLQKSINPSTYKEKILKVGVWSEDDLKVFKGGRKAFENFSY